MATRTFDELNAEVMRHYRNEDYAAVLEVLEREGEQYPEIAHMVYYLRSCMAVRVGKPEMGIKLIEEALDKGFFYGERTMRDSPSWQPLQGNPEFERLVEICKARQAEAGADAVLLTEEPESGCREDHPCPALVALHGNGSDGESALAGWRAAVSQGWLLAAVQSSQVAATKTYVWDDQATAMRDVEARYTDL